MKKTCRHILIVLAVAACFAPVAALAFQSLAATIKVSAGEVADYVLLGESPKATDGYDNAYDTLAPGASLNSTSISAYFSHPEWGAIKNNFRGDLRSPAEKQEWQLTVASTLPVGTVLTVELQTALSILPPAVQLSIRDSGNTFSANLKNGSITIAAPGPTATTDLIITATQPDTGPTIDLVNLTGCDLDNDGLLTIMDVVKVLHMAYGLEPVSAAALDQCDMDKDRVLRLVDALYLLRKLAGTI